MKKIILCILSFILFSTSAKADIIVKDGKEGEYLRKDIVSDKYTYTDEKDIQYGEYSDYLKFDDDMSLDVPCYDYELKEVTAYYKTPDVSYFEIISPLTDYAYEDLVLTYNGEVVDYEAIPNDHFDVTSKKIPICYGIMFKLDRTLSADGEINIHLVSADGYRNTSVNILFFREGYLDESEAAMKKVIYTGNDDFTTDTSWGQYRYDMDHIYYGENIPDAPEMYKVIGTSWAYRYRDILTYRYNLLPEEHNNDDNQEVTKQPADVDKIPAVSKAPVTGSLKLINLGDYQAVDVPNTSKNNLLKTILELIFGNINITQMVRNTVTNWIS